MPETYLVAKNSGDRTFLQWIRLRLQLVHNESYTIDYMWTLRDFESYFRRRSEVPRWLNWLLRKYDL